MKNYKKVWKNYVKSNSATVKEHVIYWALKAFLANESNEITKEDIFFSICRRAFTPITNKNKLANGCTPSMVIKNSLQVISWILMSEPNQKKIIFFNLYREDIINQIFDGKEKAFEDFKLFVESLKSSFKAEKVIKRYYSYIFVDQNGVEPIHQAVQAAHCAMKIGQKMNNVFDANNIYYQLCKAPVTNISEHIHLLNANGFTVETFFEPDINRTVAYGIHPVESNKRKFLKDYELLSFTG